MVTAFQPSRSDGRSDRQVIFELLREAEPESIFTYGQIGDALAEGLPETPTKERIYRAVRQGAKTLLKEQRRTIRTVRGTGYRICRADEHLELAVLHESSARRKIWQGLAILKNVREDELSVEQLKMHRGHLQLAAGLFQAIDAVRERQDRQEAAIRRILQKMGEGGSLDET